jgi:hypothetical protein
MRFFVGSGRRFDSGLENSVSVIIVCANTAFLSWNSKSQLIRTVFGVAEYLELAFHGFTKNEKNFKIRR